MQPSNTLQQSLFTQLPHLHADWQGVMAEPAIHKQLQALDDWLMPQVDAGTTIYPKHPFKALELSAPEQVKVVILGQDPYHGPEQAQGLSFSVPDHVRTPPSLRNMFKELHAEYPEVTTPPTNDLSHWAWQGVLLLNTSLTVENGKAGSHAKQGWESITDALLLHLLNFDTPKVFLLWGNHAQAKVPLIKRHANKGPIEILCSNHPSPLSALRPPVPFMGNGHFRKTNEWLVSQNLEPIIWLS